MTGWDEHVAAWSRPPVDDVGYIPSRDMMAWDDLRLMTTIRELAQTRYGGWRNHGGLWRDLLRMDTTTGKDVLDFGCGTGIEALELHNAGNRVQLADISPDNLALAARVLSLADRPPKRTTGYLVKNVPPYFRSARKFDVIHCAGVLHHIPWANGIMRRFHEVLRPGGEVRLMLYSDLGWKIATGSPVPHWTEKTEDCPGFTQFVRYFDAVGEYADWYNVDKIVQKFGQWFDLDEFAYLTEDYRYCAAVLTRRNTV